MAMSRILVGTLAGAIGVLAMSLSAHPQSHVGLSREDIKKAIAFGSFGDPKPYSLKDVELGAVYTPFLRVAFAAHQARRNGALLDAADINDRILEPIAYIAFRWPCCDDGYVPPAGVVSSPIFTKWTAIPPSRRSPGALPFVADWWRNGVDPLWVSAGGSVLSTFGATAPFADTVMVAAFPLSCLTSDHRFVLYKQWRSQEDVVVRSIVYYGQVPSGAIWQ